MNTSVYKAKKHLLIEKPVKARPDNPKAEPVPRDASWGRREGRQEAREMLV